MNLYEHRHTFHNYRYKPERYETLLQRLWHFHDQRPLPPRLNRLTREGVYYVRRVRDVHLAPRPVDGRDEYGDPVVPRQSFLAPRRAFRPPELEAVEARFRELHAMNEYLYNGDGSWEQHEYSSAYGAGIPIEAVAYRVLGYLRAYEAFGDPVFLRRAREGGDYLLRERVFADGHLRLEVHLVVELVYTFAGLALLALHRQDPGRADYLDAAGRIGDRLVEEHCTGCSDHAVMPAQLLGPLYRLTGQDRYLKAALRRVSKYAVALQLPYGGWTGADSFVWYHSIITRSAMAAYAATPNTLAYYAKKDRLARCVTAGLNRVLAGQDESGRVKTGRGDITWDYNYTGHTVRWEGGRLVPTASDLRQYTGPDELDLLVSAFEDLAVQPAAIAAHGYAGAMLDRTEVRRADFDTFAVGRYAGFLARLGGLSEQTRRKVGAAPATDRIAA